MGEYYRRIQNPMQGTLQLGIQLASTEKLLIQVKDVSGHLLFSEEQICRQSNSVLSIPVYQLANGPYLINMQTGTFNSTKTFIKQ